MGWYLAPCLVRLRDEANKAYPNRSKASDGTIGDPAHAARTSDHNPKADGKGGFVVDAIDLTDDPANGLDAHAWLRKRCASSDPRIKYAISRSQLWSPGTGWAKYSGANPHDKHVHISVRANARDSTLPWFPPAAAPLTLKDDDMPKPTDFTSACLDPVTGGYFAQTAEGGLAGHNGATVVKSYKDFIATTGPRTFLTLVPNGKGGVIQIATDGTRWNSADWN